MKKYLHSIILSILLTAVYTVSAQTYYYIPDDSLRKVLIRDYAAFMTADGKLDVAAAKGMSQDLNLDYAGITNADGIQFFESTGILRLRNNKLTAIPQLSSMKGLRRIYVNGNLITSIPDLSALYQLIDLFVGNNRITSLSGIENKTTLLYLNCAGNRITALPDLSLLINLRTLSVDHNPLTVMPDLTLNTALQQLDIGNTAIHSLPSLSALLNLERFNCDNSNMTDLSGLNDNTKLIKLSTENCLLTSLPNFANKAALTSATVYNNNLTFEDLIPLTSLSNFSVFTYSPQRALKLPLYATVRETNTFSYQASIDAAVTTNKYIWYKNGIPVQTNATGNYNFNPAFMGDSGTYYVQVTNTALPAFTLKSNASALTVRPCMEIDEIDVNIVSSDCREGALIDLEATTVSGSVGPLTYMLQSAAPAGTISATTAAQFSNIIPGTYVLQATDSRNCSASKSFILDKGADCESVFSPNGDGIMDNYFIPDTGTIQIYNSSKKLIRTMTVPAAWDGTTTGGGMADAGYYVIIINESRSIGVSLMR